MFKIHLLYTYYVGISSYHPVRKTEAICSSSLRREKRWEYGIHVILPASRRRSQQALLLPCNSQLPWSQFSASFSSSNGSGYRFFFLSHFSFRTSAWRKIFRYYICSVTSQERSIQMMFLPNLSQYLCLKGEWFKNLSQKVLWEMKEQMHVKCMAQVLAVRTCMDISSYCQHPTKRQKGTFKNLKRNL